MPPEHPFVDRVTAAELKQRLDAGEKMTVLDVREDGERAYCSIPVPPTATNLHIAMGELSGRFELLREAAKTCPLIVYCHLGVRSLAVANWLAQRGIAGVINLEGGIDAWSVEVDRSIRRY